MIVLKWCSIMSNDPLSRLSHMLESAKDLTVEAAAAAALRLAETPNHLKPKEIIKLLNSTSEREILDGLKVVIYYMGSGKGASQFFPEVIKNINSPNIKIKKLIYVYLNRFSSTHQDLVLLSINSIQKSLNDKDPEVRSLGLRIISSVTNATILPISLLAIKTSIKDLNPLVRRSCAVSISKIFGSMKLDAQSEQVLISNLKILLNDNSILVLNSAIVAYYSICPTNYELIHQHFRKYCSILMDLDEWTQIVAINIFTNYSRRFLPSPKIIDMATNQWVWYHEIENQTIPYPVYQVIFHEDMELFLTSIRNLIYSPNDAIILSITKAFLFLTPPKTLKEIEIGQVLSKNVHDINIKTFRLQVILFMILHKNSLIFHDRYKSFFLLPSDNLRISKLKLNVISLIINDNNIKNIINELKYYSLNHVDHLIANEAVKTLGKCSQINLYWNKKILNWLLNQLNNTVIVNECLNVIRYLIQQSPENNIRTIIQLSKLIANDDLNSNAKSSIIWLIGEFITIIPKFIPDFIRVLLKDFQSQDDSSVRYNILLLISKYYSYDMFQFQLTSSLDEYPKDNFISKAFRHVINLCKYDNSYDIRDQSRMLSQILSQVELSTLILQAPKPIPVILLTNQPILNNLATPKIDDLVENDIETENSVEVSPQPSNKNSFSEKKLNTNMSLPKCVLDDISNNRTNEDYQHLFIPSLSDFMKVPGWSTGELPPDSIRDVEVVKSEPAVRSLSSLPAQKTKLQFSLSLQRSKKQVSRTVQSLDDFLSNEDEELRKKRGAYASKKSVEEEEEDEEEEEEEEEDEEEEESEDEEESEEYEDDEDEEDSDDEYATMIKK